MATNWVVDPVHSEIQFKVKHLMITTVTGYFRKYNIEVETEGDDFTTASKIIFTADIDSIDTNNAQRDTHLKSADFFEAERHKQLRFLGKKYEKMGDEHKLSGDLSIRGITRPITLDVEFAGIVVDPYGQTKAGFSVDGKISRKEFGLQWNAVTEAGQIVVSDDIRIHCELQLIKQTGETTNTANQRQEMAKA
ncbi:MAG TPA: YceI family protein [Flavitalea sp.]|nr:YceI family protein [Flavitalea sp.]